MYGFRTYERGYLMGEKVTDEIWIEYMKLWWYEEYQIRRDRKLVIDQKGAKSSEGRTFPRVVSYDSITDSTGDRFISQYRSVEDEIIRHTVHACLYRAIEKLSTEEKQFLTKIYIEGMTIRKYADETKMSRTTIQYRHKKILSKLRDTMEKDAEFSREMLPESLEGDGR